MSWAERLASDWTKYDTSSQEIWRARIDGVIKTALEKAARLALMHCSCSDCREDHCKPEMAIRALMESP